jgi:hypothetical protein
MNMVIATEWTDKDWDKFTKWLHGMLLQGPAKVTFTKKDGTERVMECTLQPDVLPPVELKEDKPERKKSDTSMAVYDLEAKGWRSFVIKSVKKVNIEI